MEISKGSVFLRAMGVREHGPRIAVLITREAARRFPLVAAEGKGFCVESRQSNVYVYGL